MSELACERLLPGVSFSLLFDARGFPPSYANASFQAQRFGAPVPQVHGTCDQNREQHSADQNQRQKVQYCFGMRWRSWNIGAAQQMQNVFAGIEPGRHACSPLAARLRLLAPASIAADTSQSDGGA